MPDVAEYLDSPIYLPPEERDITAGNRLRQAELLDEQRHRARLQSSRGQPFSGEELLPKSESHKVVLLGAPGSGKSTLLSYFAINQISLQGLLPIIIRIRDMERSGDQHSILDYLRIFAENTLAVRHLPPGFFEHWLEDGRVLILLDGLDEVVDDARRNTIAEKIGLFLTQFTSNRAIITSRPAGYRRDFFKTDLFHHFELQPFDEKKIETFIDSWYTSRIRDPEEAERRKENLKKALSDNKQISRLAQNPLLLTIIALIHRYQAVLPKHRYKLYEKAVETLLISWDANKEISRDQVFHYLTLDLEFRVGASV
jgi:predicted NACHT family NTPase